MTEQHDHDHDEDHDHEEEVPEGAAVLPLIPAELGVQPLLLATLHPLVFLIASADEVVNCAAAEEALQYMMTYLRRLKGQQRDRVREDMACLLEFARQDSWSEEETNVLRHVFEQFLTEFDDEPEGEAQA
jgi:hypothetical protein